MYLGLIPKKEGSWYQINQFVTQTEGRERVINGREGVADKGITVVSNSRVTLSLG